MRAMIISGLACGLLGASTLIAQQEIRATCHNCPGVYIPSEEI